MNGNNGNKNLKWKEHDCNGCKRSGECSIETIARYIRHHPEPEEWADHANSKFLELGEFTKTILQDSMMSKEEPVYYTTYMAFLTGFAIASGAIPYKTKFVPSLIALISSLERITKEED